MGVEFNSIDVLYNRVRPALQMMKDKSVSIGYSFDNIDIWNYLVNTKWKDGCDLTLFDIVRDILNINPLDVSLYVKRHGEQ